MSQKSFQIIGEDGAVRPMNDSDWRTMVELAELEKKLFDPCRIPTPVMRGLTRYVNQGIRPGQFLSAVISNNLSEAIGRGDPLSIEGLPALVRYIYNSIPGAAWGSEEKLEKWLARFKVPEGGEVGTQPDTREVENPS